MPSRCSSQSPLLGLSFLFIFAACHSDPVATFASGDSPSAPSVGAMPSEVADARFGLQAPARPQIPLDTVLTALRNPARSDASLIIGLKEADAVRGVSVSGIALPNSSRSAAQASILRDVPAATLVEGFARQFDRTVGGLTVHDTVYTTSIVVRIPMTRDVLQQLRAHPNIDYLQPNWIGELSTAIVSPFSLASTLAMASVAETRAWGIDTVRAPYVWSQGYTGGTVPLGVADSGFDVGHPDFQFNSSFNNFTTNQPDNACTVPFTACWWEDPYHGSGVLGLARVVQNSAAAVGVAHGGTGTVDIAKIAYITSGGLVGIRSDDFTEGVLFISSTLHSYGTTGIAVTAAGFGPQQTDTSSSRKIRPARTPKKKARIPPHRE